jgi:hypothetical protein
MKTKNALLSLALFLISMISFSQSQEKSSDSYFKKNLIGLQYNPVWDGNNTYVANLISIRYGYKIARPLTIGTELSGYFYNNNFSAPFYDPDMSPNHYYRLSANIFLRYSIRPEKRLQGFLEISPYWNSFFKEPMKYIDGDLCLYAAPGLSVFSKNKKFSMDLYYKFSTQFFINQSYRELSYKLNFHF